jgi:bifunctional non-homologous end joining protein LigD
MMQTPDGEWRVEVYRQPRTRSYWYRLVHGDNAVEGLTIAGVERLLAEAGYDLADLTEVAA